MACKRNLGFSTPVAKQPASSPQSTNDLLKHLISGVNSLSRQIAAQTARIDEIMQRLDALERNNNNDHQSEEEPSQAPKRVKRARNVSIAEAVRRLHNSESNPHKYDPQTGVSSPRNQAVLTYLLEELKTTFADVDPECIKACCRTYYETLRRKYSLSQPGRSEQRDSIKAGAKSRQRKRRLLESRSKVLQTDAERELWQTAVVELMSDEEDPIINERPVWVVRSPLHRNPQLSDLCQQLQQRLEADMQYTCTHRQRVRTDEPTA